MKHIFAIDVKRFNQAVENQCLYIELSEPIDVDNTDQTYKLKTAVFNHLSAVEQEFIAPCAYVYQTGDTDDLEIDRHELHNEILSFLDKAKSPKDMVKSWVIEDGTDIHTEEPIFSSISFSIKELHTL